jgi:hypothetical protein
MSSQDGVYDTSRMYRTGSHLLEHEDRVASVANVDRMAQSASAILACGEYLATAKEMPSDQREAVDMLRREIRTLVYGLSVLTAVKARSHRVE